MKYRKKPVVIEAMQYDGTEKNANEIIDALCPSAVDAQYMHGYFYIYTREGTMKADPNDWIIKGTDGELYPCKPNIFPTIYYNVEDACETSVSVQQ